MSGILYRSGVLLAVFLSAAFSVAADQASRSEFIFETAPHAQCHSSTLAETSSGLVAAWFGGSREGADDVGIWISRQDGGRWTPPTEVANGIQFTRADGAVVRHPCWNPVLFQPRTGALMLFYKVGPPAAWWGMLATSEDHGRTWSVPRPLPEGILGPIKNKPVELADGTILCASSTETTTAPSRWQVHFEATRDGGRSWWATAPINDGVTLSAIQPSVLVYADGRLDAIGRTKQGRIFSTRSADAGRTWTSLELTGLPNPNSGTDAVTLADGRQLLVYNHVGLAANGRKGPRSPLNVAVSRDGREWEAVCVLENEPGEYSYPVVIQTRDGLIHITYTWKRERIKHVTLDLGRFQPRPIVEGVWPAAPVAMSAPKT